MDARKRVAILWTVGFFNLGVIAGIILGALLWT